MLRYYYEGLIDVAKRNPFQNTLYQSHILTMEMYIKVLLEYQKHLSSLEKEIDASAKDIAEYKIIQCIQIYPFLHNKLL